MKIGIVGWGIEGKSAYDYFGPEHSYLIVNEQPNDSFPPQSDKIKVQFLSKHRTPGITGNATDLSYLDGIDECDLIIYTPTSRKNLEKIYPSNHPFWTKAKTNQHIFFEQVKTKNIIGVTGTKGKGTTSTLIARMLEASGKKVHFGGNVGRAVLDFVKDVESDDWVVLELANFQLYKFPYSPHIAVCLMLVPEHLDWHPDMADYIEAKSNIFRHQQPDDIAIYFPDNEHSASLAKLSPGIKIPYLHPPGAYITDGQLAIGLAETKIAAKSEIKLLGEHNIENICAAVTAVWQVSQDVKAIRGVISSFTGLEHRLELVGDFNGVKYYDDSFSTNPATSIVALRAFTQPKVIILGGVDKGLPFDELAREVASNNVRHAIVIGDTTDKIVQALSKVGFSSITTGLRTMPDIIEAAAANAQAGDVVLLSPGSSSFDLFDDYKDRGNQFKTAVENLS